MSEVTQEAAALAPEQAAEQQTVSDPVEEALAVFRGEKQPEHLAEPVVHKPAEDKSAQIAQNAQDPAQSEGQGETKSEYYARISELDRQNRILRKQLKDIESRSAEPKAPVTDLKSIAKKDPLKALGELGIGIDDVLEAYTGSGSVSSDSKRVDYELPMEVQEKLSKIEQFEKFIEEQKQSQQRTHQERLLQQETDKLAAVVGASSEKYEMINATRDEGSLTLVLQVAAEIYNQEGEVPSYERALGLVEDHLRERAKAQWEKAKNLSFLKNILTSDSNVVQLANKSEKSAASSTKSVPAREDTPTPKELTEEDLYQQALKHLSA